VGFVEYLSNPHLPDCLHLNNLTGKPAAIVVNPSGRRPDSVEAAEWLWIQNNYFYFKKKFFKSSSIHILIKWEKLNYLFFRRTKTSRPDNAAIARNGLSDDEYVPVLSGTVFIVTGGSVVGGVVVRVIC
jgi:hypothetical protein